MSPKDHKKSRAQNEVQSASELEIKQLKAQIEELKLGWQRTQADFENFRRHWQEEKQSLQQFITINNLLEISPVLDNLQRAFDQLALQEVQSEWVTGFKQIHKQFLDTLAKYGLKKIDTIGEQFNPAKHEAVSQLNSEHFKAGTIMQEVESGYEFEGKVIKPAKVVVSRGE